MAKPTIAIIGNGKVGSALQKGLTRAGYEVKSAGKDPKAVKEIAAWGETIVLAVPFPAIDDTVKELGEAARGKIVVDATNALTPDYKLAVGYTTSGAEELQKKLPGARVVKAFNTVFSGTMSTGKAKNTPLTLFAAGNDKDARERVLAMGRDIGFEAVDAGPLENARWLETLGYFNIQLGFSLKMGTEIGFKLVH